MILYNIFMHSIYTTIYKTDTYYTQVGKDARNRKSLVRWCIYLYIPSFMCRSREQETGQGQGRSIVTICILALEVGMLLVNSNFNK